MHAPHTTWAGARGGPVVHIFARLRVMPRPWKIRNTIQRLRLYSECWVSSPPARASGGLWGPTNNMGFFCDFQRELKTLKIYGSPRIFVWEREREERTSKRKKSQTQNKQRAWPCCSWLTTRFSQHASSKLSTPTSKLLIPHYRQALGCSPNACVRGLIPRMTLLGSCDKFGGP